MKKSRLQKKNTPKLYFSFFKLLSLVYFSSNYSHSATRGISDHDAAMTMLDGFIQCGRISCSSRLPQVESRLHVHCKLLLKAESRDEALTDSPTVQSAARDGVRSHTHRCLVQDYLSRRREGCRRTLSSCGDIRRFIISL